MARFTALPLQQVRGERFEFSPASLPQSAAELLPNAADLSLWKRFCLPGGIKGLLQRGLQREQSV